MTASSRDRTRHHQNRRVAEIAENGGEVQLPRLPVPDFHKQALLGAWPESAADDRVARRVSRPGRPLEQGGSPAPASVSSVVGI
jgi:hypothetical protein